MHSVESQITFKTSMLRSSLCDYSDAYILVNGTITIPGEGADDAIKEQYLKTVHHSLASYAK